MPPTITFEQAKGFIFFMLKAVISWHGYELIGVPSRLLMCAILARTAPITLLVLLASVCASAQTSCSDPAPAFTANDV